MADLKTRLLSELKNIPGVEATPSPVSGGIALFHNGKPFAHFHNDNEIDLRLTKKRIKQEGLSHQSESIYHPGRSLSSAWIEVRFHTEDELTDVVRLVGIAVNEL